MNRNMGQNKDAAVKATMFDGLISELKKVTWPSRQKTVRLTIIVLLISLIIGAYVGIIDILLTKVLETLTKTK